MRFLKALFWIVGALVAVAIGLGEPLVCMGFLAIPILGWQIDNRLAKGASVLVAIAGLWLHFQGYKLFGAPKVVDGPELQGAMQVAALESPNRLRFIDGKTQNIEGIYFPRTIDLTEANERTVALWFLSSRSRESQLMVSVDEQSHRGKYLERIHYFCGNTFYPTILPGRLPRHRPKDVAGLLVQANLALPDADSRDSAYHKELMRIFLSSPFRGDYAAFGAIERGDKVAIPLGNALIQESDHFIAGAELLIAAQAEDSYPAIEQEIRRRQQHGKMGLDPSLSQFLLAKINPAEARRQALAMPPPINPRNPSAEWATLAIILACHGDLSGIDYMQEILGKPHFPHAMHGVLMKEIAASFRWPHGSPQFFTWYARVRPRLHSGRTRFGEPAFWLDDGQPFDEAYMQSMQQAMQSN